MGLNFSICFKDRQREDADLHLAPIITWASGGRLSNKLGNSKHAWGRTLGYRTVLRTSLYIPESMSSTIYVRCNPPRLALVSRERRHAAHAELRRAETDFVTMAMGLPPLNRGDLMRVARCAILVRRYEVCHLSSVAASTHAFAGGVRRSRSNAARPSNIDRRVQKGRSEPAPFAPRRASY